MINYHRGTKWHHESRESFHLKYKKGYYATKKTEEKMRTQYQKTDIVREDSNNRKSKTYKKRHNRQYEKK